MNKVKSSFKTLLVTALGFIATSLVACGDGSGTGKTGAEGDNTLIGASGKQTRVVNWS